MGKKILQNLFNYALKEGAAGLTMESAASSLVLNYRFPDGNERLFSLPQKVEKNLLLALHELLTLTPGELTTKKYCKITNKKQSLSFYLTILPNKNGEKIIINIINRPLKNWRLNQLGLQTADLKILKGALKKRSGLILVSSPAENGKSATLTALLSELNPVDRNIYVFGSGAANPLPGVNYLKPTLTNFTNVLRHDSDVLVVDDIANAEIFKNIIRAATTGRLVIATLSADSSLEAFKKIINLPLPLRLKLEGWQLFLNQRLVKLKRSKTVRSKGARPEIGIFEILELSPKLKKSLTDTNEWDKKFWLKFSNLALREGFKPLETDLKQKIKDGLAAA
ncbi:MAG: ATPase, T2SS/T4P/T4SS family [Patescibacteria group bacterium]